MKFLKTCFNILPLAFLLATCTSDDPNLNPDSNIGTDIFVAVGDFQSWYSTDGNQWEKFNGLPGGDFFSVAFGEGKFVAGDDDGRIWSTSTIDTDTWNQSPVGAFSTVIRDVAYGNGTFVAVGEDFDAFAWFSDDGESWNLSDLSGTDFLTGVAFGEGRFVAIGRSKTPPNPATLWVSDDGEVWSSLELGGLITHVTYGNGEFRVTGSTSVNQQLVPICWSSPDGLIWTPAVMSNELVFAGPIAYGNNRWVSVSTSNFQTQLWWSDDGITWNTQNIGGVRPKDLVFAEGRFIMVGERGYIRWSETGDPNDWTDASIPSGGGWIEAITFGN